MFFRSTRYARRALLTTVSTAALVLAVNGQTEAQDASPAWWASIEGQYNWVEGDALDLYSLSAEPKDGWAGRLHLGGRISDDWSVALGLRYGKVNKESDDASYYSNFSAHGGASEFDQYYVASSDLDVSYKEDHLVLDLEIGRDIGIGDGGNVRVFGGLRFARFDGDGKIGANYFSSAFGDYTNFSNGGSYDIDTTHRFTGAGPRIGVDAAIPVAENVRVDIGVAGAALFGRRKLKVKGSYSSFYGSGEFQDSESKNVIVPNVEASVALTYLLGPNASISAGYRAEQFWNIMPTIEGFSSGNDDRLIHGPFLRLTITGN